MSFNLFSRMHRLTATVPAGETLNAAYLRLDKVIQRSRTDAELDIAGFQVQEFAAQYHGQYYCELRTNALYNTIKIRRDDLEIIRIKQRIELMTVGKTFFPVRPSLS